MKILFVVDTFSMGGAEKSILAIASKMRRAKPVVCSLYDVNTLANSFIDAGVEIIELKLSKSVSDFTSARALRRVIEAVKPDIVHATLFRAEMACRIALWRKENPVLVGSFVGDTYGTERYRELTYFARVKLRGLQVIDRFTSRRVSIFVSISEFLRKSYEWKLGIPREKIVVIPRGRDIVRFLFSEHSIVSEHVRFVAVGRLIKLKGHADLIRAFVKVHELYPGSSLKIAGEGGERGRLQQLISELGLSSNVQLLGNVKDIAGLLADSDIFVFPSHYEGQGGVLVEAMLSGIPIIASDIDVVRESVTHNYSGILTEVRNVDTMAHSMQWAIQNYETAKKFAVHAREVALKRFDIDVVVANYEDLYESLIGGKEEWRN